MLDLKFVRENPDAVKGACRRKRIEANVDALLDADGTVRELKRLFEEKRAEQNKRSKNISRLGADERKQALDGMKALSQEVKDLENRVKEAEEILRVHMLQIPNIPADDVPQGEDDTENVEIRRWGEPRKFDFETKDHVQIGQELDLLDIERASRIAGSRTYFLKNEGAILELSVLRLALDHMLAKGFTPMIVPHLVRSEAMEGTAYLPGVG